MDLQTDYCTHLTYVNEHAATFLKNYGNLLTWKSDKPEIVADIGCANGFITTDVLLPYCGNKVDKIIGIDMSKKMLELANKINKTPSVSFVEVNVSTEDLDPDLVEKFGHIFSFYTLHMIANQRQFAMNFYRMLKPGGEVFITFIARSTRFEGMFAMTKHERWSKYLEEVPKNFGNYWKSDRPQEDFESIFNEVGFLTESYKPDNLKVVYTDRKKFEESIIKVNVLLNYIPENLRAEFLKDHLELMTKLCKKGDSYVVIFESIVGIARKR